MRSSAGAKRIQVPCVRSTVRSNKPSHQVLVLNASYEPLSVVSAPRALNLLWEGKASSVISRATWRSAGGQEVDVPSVVSLRRYINPPRRNPPLNRKTILMRDLGQCQYCDKCAENIDHIIPRSKGGGTTWENCVAACKHCNGRKGAMYLKDVPNMKLKRKPGPPSNISWVHAAVWKVDHRWKPYIGDVSWEEMEKKLKANGKKPRKSAKQKASEKKAKAHKQAQAQAKYEDVAKPPPPPAEKEDAEAESIIAAYTGNA